MKTTYSIAVPATKVQKEIQLFNNPEFGELRTIKDENNKIWFSLNDVMKPLGLSHITRLKSRLSDDGCTTSTVSTPIISQGVDTGKTKLIEMIFIDEPNLYRCIFQSRKQEAEKFQYWVFEEVLPSIRKSGGYIVSHKNETPEMIMARALQVAQQTIANHMQKVQILEGENEIQKEQIKELAPKAEYTDKVLQSTSTYTTSQIAQGIGMSAVTLNKKLFFLGIQYRQSGQWMLYSKYRDLGLTDIRVYAENDKTYQSMVWTEKGRQFIHSLKSEGRL